MNERGDTPDTNEDWRVTINTPPEYAAYRSRFINMLEHLQEMWDRNRGQINTATIESSYPCHNPEEFMIYRTTSVRKGKKLKKGI